MAGADMRPTTEIEADREGEVLATAKGLALLAEVSAIARPSPSDMLRWRKQTPPELVNAAIRLADGRRRGVSKFERAGLMWFEATALEQATAEPVARHKARRFEGADVVDLCCGIGGDSIAMGELARLVIAVDRDPGMARRAFWNAEVYGVKDRVCPVVARAERFGIPRTSLVHIDPDRRARTASRSKAIAGYVPGLDFLRRLPGRCRGGAIKLGPASDFAERFADPSWEIEVVSLDGECKEVRAWFGDPVSCRRRATALPSGASWTDRDTSEGRAPVGPLGAWIYEVDAALIRAGFADGFAIEHRMGRILAGIDLFTGAAGIESPWVNAFEVEAETAMDWRAIRAQSRRSGLHLHECKTRGMPEFRPESLRSKIRSDGGRPATLFLLRDRTGSRAIFATRKSGPG